MRRIFLLILCALLCILPAAALADDPTVGDTVEFGTYDDTPVEWIVVDDQKTSMGTDGMFLVAKDAVYPMQLRSIRYQDSGLPDACDNFYWNAFTPAEKAKILPTTVAARTEYNYNGTYAHCTDAALDADGVFLLSATEYGKYSENIPKPSTFCYFRTHSTSTFTEGIMGVDRYGDISYVGSGSMVWEWGFRPAINLSKEAFATPTPTPEPTPAPNPAPATGDNAPIVLLALTVLAAAAMLLRRRETN